MRVLGLLTIGLVIQLQLLIALVSSLSFSKPSPPKRVLRQYHNNKEQTVHVHAETKHEEVSPSRRAILWQMQKSPLAIGLSAMITPTTSHATTTKTTASTNPSNLQEIYNDAASTYDTLYSDSIISRQLDFTSLRQNLLSKAYGNVLELGVGTGLNLPFYPPLEEEGGINPITSYTAVDLSPNMMARAKDRFRIQNTSNDHNNNGSEGDTTGRNDAFLVSSSLALLYKEDKVSFQLGDLGNLSQLFDSGTKFDTIIDTFGLCVFPNPALVLSQAKDLLVESSTFSGRGGVGGGGQLLLLEHQDSFIGKVLSPTRSLSDVSGTCRYDDDVRGLLKQAGFRNVRGKDVAGGFLLEVVAQQ